MAGWKDESVSPAERGRRKAQSRVGDERCCDCTVDPGGSARLLLLLLLKLFVREFPKAGAWYPMSEEAMVTVVEPW